MTKQANEQYIPLTEVPQRIPFRRNGKVIHISTVWRWATRGVRGCRLETWRIGGATCTTQVAIDRFIRSMNQSDKPKPIKNSLSKFPSKTRSHYNQEGW